MIRRKAPKVALVDQTTAPGLDTMKQIARNAPGVALIAIGVCDDPEQIIACAESGASGYLCRDASLSDLAQAVEDAANGTLRCSGDIARLLFCHIGRLVSNGSAVGSATGRDALTRREGEILELIERGESNKIIARHLGIEVATVKNHVHNLLAKLGVRRRGEAAAMHRRRPGERTRTPAQIRLNLIRF